MCFESHPRSSSCSALLRSSRIDIICSPFSSQALNTALCTVRQSNTNFTAFYCALTVDILSRTKCSAFCCVQLPLVIKVCGFAKWKPASVQCECTVRFSTLPAAQKTSRLSRLRGWLESTVTTRVVRIRMRIVSTFTIQDLEIPQTWCFWFKEFLFPLSPLSFPLKLFPFPKFCESQNVSSTQTAMSVKSWTRIILSTHTL